MGFLAIEVLVFVSGGVVGVMIGVSFYRLPVLAPILIASFIAAIILWWPEIKSSMDPSERVLRRGEAKARAAEREQEREFIRDALKNPILGKVEYDPTTSRISAPLVVPQSWWYRCLSRFKVVPRKTLVFTVRTSTRTTHVADFRRLNDMMQEDSMDRNFRFLCPQDGVTVKLEQDAKAFHLSCSACEITSTIPREVLKGVVDTETLQLKLSADYMLRTQLGDDFPFTLQVEDSTSQVEDHTLP